MIYDASGQPLTDFKIPEKGQPFTIDSDLSDLEESILGDHVHLRIIAFSCCHLADPAFLESELRYRSPSHEDTRKLFRYIIRENPDLVVNLGDLYEGHYYGVDSISKYAPEYFEMMEKCQVIELGGNHDPMLTKARTYMAPNGVQYTHGHIGTPRFPAGYGWEPKEKYSNLLYYHYLGKHPLTVYGHTHMPLSGPMSGFPLNVGSVLETKTFGEIVGKQASLRKISDLPDDMD